MEHLLFASRDMRDERWRELRARGMNARRGTVRNQQLHPMYVEDVPSGDTGFGNTEYRTSWSVLYRLEW